MYALDNALTDNQTGCFIVFHKVCAHADCRTTNPVICEAAGRNHGRLGFHIYIVFVTINQAEICDGAGLILDHFIKATFVGPKERPYKTDNFYSKLHRYAQANDEIMELVMYNLAMEPERNKNNKEEIDFDKYFREKEGIRGSRKSHSRREKRSKKDNSESEEL